MPSAASAPRSDNTLRHQFRFTDKLGLQSEFFNILSHPNFGSQPTT
jgi:hypothetical protein